MSELRLRNGSTITFKPTDGAVFIGADASYIFTDWTPADQRRLRLARRARRRWLALWKRHYTSKHGRRGWISYRTMELLHGPLKYTGEVGRVEGCRFIEYTAPSTYKAPLKFRKRNRGRTL